MGAARREKYGSEAFDEEKEEEGVKGAARNDKFLEDVATKGDARKEKFLKDDARDQQRLRQVICMTGCVIDLFCIYVHRNDYMYVDENVLPDCDSRFEVKTHGVTFSYTRL